MKEAANIEPWAKIDCRHFRGEKPCEKRRFGCEACTLYDPAAGRVLIIKLAAMGDVIRTTPILEPIHKKHARTHVTWLVDPAAAPLLRGLAGIDEIMEMGAYTHSILSAREFDALYCLDKEPRAAALSATVRARTKKGFTMSPLGALTVHDGDAAYALRLGIDDRLKFLENTKTYQEIVFEACGFAFTGERVHTGITDEERAEGRALLAGLGRGPFVGLNTGAGDVFATKRLPEETTAALARAIKSELGMTPVLLGGEAETARNARILKMAGNDLINAGTHHPVRRFASIVSGLAALVCTDTLAMHLAVAEDVPTVAIFGPTCAQEVHLYGRGEKIVMSPWCAPCYKRECTHHTCMNEVRVEEVVARLRAVRKL